MRNLGPTGTGADTQGGSELLRDLQLALSKPPHAISPKYFYDAQGSRLFDRICDLPEYYPTRTEWGILSEHAAEIAEVTGPGTELIEFGAGSLSKVRLLLNDMRPRRYLPVDISVDHLHRAAASLRAEFPWLEVAPVAGDYTGSIDLPPVAWGARRIGFFPGSTIGNFTPSEALEFLRRAAQMLRGGGLLIGADLLKDPSVLDAAYNDAKGVTADFNKNLLARANRELGADFELSEWWHSAFFNPAHSRVEMHLISRRDQRVHLGGITFEVAEGFSLHTENSYKFSIEGLRGLAAIAGFRPHTVWTDDRKLFSVHWLIAP
ncbi:L-histidine N(alpha)-methyltransferase [Caenimonas soli]|uniref:L-histidine N(alpha)-methyltransferase n=1 Tax=Caenimonas soli TaxID=2735555 RepID=UPI00155565DB|nr:L-histidine N(alpha)-methyltransferase [Caenimonas soli]NPC58504.1 L-histidine N(alpha)-methyltransferase [Caenimonas soli]